MIELKHLKTLQTLRDTGSLVAAATRLHLTQSALSHQVSEIEQRLGYKFFIRKSQPIQFTYQGNILLNLADTILPQVKAAIKTCQTPSLHTLKMAIECHSCIQWLTPAIKAFTQAHPHINLELESGIVFDLQPLLLQSGLDLLITSDILRPNELDYTALFDFEVRLILPPNHSLANKAVIQPEDLANLTLLTYPVPKQRLDIWQHFLSPAAINPPTKMVDNTSLLIQMVSAGMGVAALPHWAVATPEQHNLIVTKPLGEGLWRRLYTASRREETPKALPAFIQTIKQHTLNSLPLIKSV